MKFLVWNEKNSSRKTATPIEAEDHRAAAIEYAQRSWSPDDGDSFDVTVLRLGADKALLFCIDVDFEVSFDAMKIGPTSAEREEEATQP